MVLIRLFSGLWWYDQVVFDLSQPRSRTGSLPPPTPTSLTLGHSSLMEGNRAILPESNRGLKSGRG